jgi:N-methylhydantoinase B/oxoprolinase/acetone carboxylase alpha subunit
MNLPAEAMELEAPIRIHRVALRTDSGGPGQYRGGLGVVREYEILCDEARFSHRGERHFHAAAGVAGGQPGAVAHSRIVRADGTEEPIPSKLVTLLRHGDRVIVETAGGGGVGDASTRDPEALANDIANGKVSASAARASYGQRAAN